MTDPEQPLKEVFCRFCGTSTLPTDSFCRHCGAALQGAESTARAEPRPATAQERSEPLVSATTAALLIWLLATLAWSYSYNLNTVTGLAYYSLVILGPGGTTLLVLLAVVGVATHYYYGGRSTLFPNGWGPLVAIVAVVLVTFNDAYLYALGFSVFSNWPILFFTVFLYVVLVALSYVEYRKETRSLKRQPELEQPSPGRGRVSFGVRRRVDELKADSRTTQKRIGREITLLIVALPIIFLEPLVFEVALPVSEGRFLIDGVLMLSAIFFLRSPCARGRHSESRALLSSTSIALTRRHRDN